MFAAAAAASPPPHLDLKVTLDPESRRFSAVAKLEAHGEFRFSLHRSLAVTGSMVGGRREDAVLARVNGNLREWRLSAPAAGALLRIEYGGTLPALDPSLDFRSVLRNLPPMAAAGGTFLPQASGWYPSPAEFFSYSVSLSLPVGQRGLVPGDLVSESVPKDGRTRYTAHFDFPRPSGGIALMAGPYVVRETVARREDGRPLKLRTYFFADIERLAPDYLEASRGYIERYSREIGDYPFGGFSVVASPLPTGFGMPTLTYLGAQVLKLPFIRTTSLGHEVLHNWWGNGVYVDDASGNWSEGLTTFMADYRYKEDASEAAARAMRLSWLRDFAALAPAERRPLAAFHSRVHGAEAAVGYGKAAMVFFMLRDAIGTDAFRRGVRLFWQKNRFRTASWDDLRQAFEETSGRKLAAFFDQWLHRRGAPRIAIAEAGMRDVGGKTRLAITLTQGHPPYSVNVPVEITTGERAETRLVALSQSRKTAEVDVEKPATAVKLDPDLRLWRGLDPTELPPILRQWIVAPAPRLLVASPDAEFRDAARAFSQAFFEAPAKRVSAEDARHVTDPLLIVGLERDVDTLLRRLSIAPPPASVAARGSAQVWTVYRPDRTAHQPPTAVVSVRDVPSLRAIQRSLQHYGAQSYLAFDGSRAVKRGVWPWHSRPVPVTRAGR